MSNGKSVSLSKEAIHWVETNGSNFSKTLDKVILQHRDVYSDIKKQEALDQLRAAAVFLAQNANIKPDAIVAWVRDVVGVLDKPPSPSGSPNPKSR